MYAIAYAGAGFDGFLKTIEITTNRGIFKGTSYGIDANDTHAFATINKHTLEAEISQGYQYVALTYDNTANLQKL